MRVGRKNNLGGILLFLPLGHGNIFTSSQSSVGIIVECVNEYTAAIIQLYLNTALYLFQDWQGNIICNLFSNAQTTNE